MSSLLPALKFSSRHHYPLNSSQVRFVLLLLLRRPLPMQRVETMLILILSLLNDAEVSSPTNADAGVMLRNKSDEYKGLVNKDLKLSKQEIPAGH
ncbi:hypothetical protein HBI52_191000 [Parastagonospora nodorum]|nr:hypothetical protein HBI52_191000 [Parastagonospora nodorum]